LFFRKVSAYLFRIEVEGATEGLKILPEEAVMGRVVEIYRGI